MRGPHPQPLPLTSPLSSSLLSFFICIHHPSPLLRRVCQVPGSPAGGGGCVEGGPEEGAGGAEGDGGADAGKGGGDERGVSKRGWGGEVWEGDGGADAGEGWGGSKGNEMMGEGVWLTVRGVGRWGEQGRAGDREALCQVHSLTNPLPLSHQLFFIPTYPPSPPGSAGRGTDGGRVSPRSQDGNGGGEMRDGGGWGREGRLARVRCFFVSHLCSKGGCRKATYQSLSFLITPLHCAQPRTRLSNAIYQSLSFLSTPPVTALCQGRGGQGR